ncbi:hypothetical protein AVEN_262398-1 [Araneus ventricosus]|uniref:Uncharacterized protein n=1 Tax=Araneus ventricosus TaxID=182803 RepID=A0A4Y2R088_ARAVE|nr:hypothetical protein AVEN_262398-1 [Araneus ventricosus]
MVKSRLLHEEKRMSRAESEDVTHEERALHTKNYQTQRRSAAGKPRRGGQGSKTKKPTEGRQNASASVNGTIYPGIVKKQGREALIVQ